jgi:RNA polymerase sigma factor (TIGR02999 family)
VAQPNLANATGELSLLLDRLNGGQSGAFAALIDAVYDDLRRNARQRMSEQFRSRPLGSLTVAPTAIVNDALIELRAQRAQWQNPDHFFAVATLLIRRLVLQYQRHRLAEKRGAGQRGARIDDTNTPEPVDPRHDAAEQLAGGEALDTLQRLHEQFPRKAEVVSLHVLCGHPLPKVAEMIGVSLPTAERDWRFARAWLKEALQSQDGADA